MSNGVYLALVKKGRVNSHTCHFSNKDHLNGNYPTQQIHKPTGATGWDLGLTQGAEFGFLPSESAQTLCQGQPSPTHSCLRTDTLHGVNRAIPLLSHSTAFLQCLCIHARPVQRGLRGERQTKVLSNAPPLYAALETAKN